MSRASAMFLDIAVVLLRHEGGGAGSWAAAAGRVLDKLHAELNPLLGAAGVLSLVGRSATLAGSEHALDVASVQTSTQLEECLSGLHDAASLEAARALFGTFLTLMTTFVGERLTIQALRKGWPEILATGSGETTK